jgi:hypothetical protein
MKHILFLFSLVTFSLAQVDSTQIVLDRYNKENESITGSITHAIVKKDLVIQELTRVNMQLAKENQMLKAQLEAKKKEEKK